MNSTHTAEDRGLDAYFSPYEGIWPLIDLEPDMPMNIWEPSAGDGRIVRCLKQHGFKVYASDIADYGVKDVKIDTGMDYLKSDVPFGIKGIVTNPPYKLAREFIEKAVSEVPYSAWLLRLNFLESERRLPFFNENPPARIWVSSRRMPMMHRLGWEGPVATSNTCFAWFVWDSSATVKRQIGWFDWKKHKQELESEY